MNRIDLSRLSRPFLLNPDNFTDQMWGGAWIPKLKGLPDQQGPVGESWEFSLRAERPSKVLDDALKNSALSDLARQFPNEMLGSSTPPFLVKFIDANDDLSLQVHPSDEHMASFGKNSDSGKSEVWIVLDTDGRAGDGYIYLGFNPDKAAGYSEPAMFEAAFFDAINQANSMGPTLDPQVRAKAEALVVPFLNKIRVEKGQIFKVVPGTIHATGRGVRLFEIQESSDETYRVWDWNRPDAKKLMQGRNEFRALHLKEAQAVLDFHPVDPEKLQAFPVPMESHSADVLEELMIREDDNKFAVTKILFANTGSKINMSTKRHCQVLTAIRGAVWVGESLKLKAGHSAFVPACVPSFELKSEEPGTWLLRSFVPV